MQQFSGPGQTPKWSAGMQEAHRRRLEQFQERLRRRLAEVQGEGRPDEADLPVLDLRIDPSYQRTGTKIDQGKVIEYACSWSWALCGRLVVNLRPTGAYYVIDGGHRKEAFALLNDGPLLSQATLPCFVMHLKTVAEEAKLFDDLNTYRTAVGYEQRFQSRLVYSEWYAVNVVDCIESVGLEPVYVRQTPAKKTQPGQCGALNTCERILRRTDPETLKAVLSLATGAWATDPLGVHRTLLLALFDFHVRFAGEYGAKDLTALLRRVGPQGCLDAAPVQAAPATRASRISLFLHERYNHRRTRAKLPPFTLDGDSGFREVLRAYRRKRTP